MKILELRFKNLNSLYGEWGINFTKPEYVFDGIFAITGPTGAGKSTILDAICLALYGRTPRLKSIAKSSNEIMSRQTGECFAEVTFETRTGSFRCHWSQHKARKKADGNLTDSKHEVSDTKTGQIIESKKRDVAIRVEKETGMDFERFTRSMMLAQGGFAAFLQAGSDQRAPILEQITGTRIYSEISKGVHDRRRNEENSLDLLQAETAGIDILGVEQEDELNRVLSCKKKTEKEQNKKNDRLGKDILWMLGIDALKKDSSKIDAELQTLSRELTAFLPDRSKLETALKAAELDSVYATLVSKREQQAHDLKALAHAKTRVPEQEKILGLKAAEFNEMQETLSKVKDEQKRELVLIQKVRTLDLLILEKQSVLKNIGSECRKIETQVVEKKGQHQRAKTRQESSAKELAGVETYLSANARDAELVTALTGINEQIKTLQLSMANSVAIRYQALEFKKRFATDLARHKKQETICHTLKKNHAAAKNSVLQTGKAMAHLLGDRLLREYRAEHDGLLREMAYLGQIASLEENRMKLEDGKACPLCGALHHPFAKGNVPQVDKIEEKVNKLSRLIRKADQLEKNLKAHEDKEKTTGSELAEAEKHLMELLHRQEGALANVQRSEKELEKASDKSAELKRKMILTLEPFGIKTLPDTRLDAMSDTLKTRQIRWQAYQKQKIEIEKNLIDLMAIIKNSDAVLKTLYQDLKEKNGVLSEYQKDLERLVLDRNRRYGRKNPNTEEKRLNARVSAAETSEKAARNRRDEKERQLNELKTRIAALKENTAKTEPGLSHLESSFQISRKKAGFEDEATFISSQLSVDERNKLNQKARALDNKQVDIATRKKDREIRLYQETAKKMTDLPLDTLKKEQATVQESLKVIGEEVGAVKQKLLDNTAAKARIQQKIGLINAQKKECARWDALHSLIGSADGKKYRNFAQGITFELMVSHANQQLEKMSDRYLLVRDETQPLELNIVDNYQAGEIRSTKNLSGGESFIVSLSLALGLSHMASRNVRVDSLFLDEGFGTLDEDALETSLEALSGLHQDGKLIGVISHVPALKERISTQINIIPVSGGKSRIAGPGCKGVNEANLKKI